MKTEKKQHLKGSVLFTVVSVMSLLVIFLMGTLVLATSASNRSHKNYSTSQAEYTARAAIESFSQAMGRNAAVAQTVVDMSKNTSIQPTVVMEDSQMGSVGYYNDSGAWVDDKINVEYVDDTYVYSDGKWEEQQVLRVTATAQVGKEESTVSLYLRKKAPNEPNPLAIKGFQTLGGGGYTTTQGYISGAVSMGILDDGTNTFDLTNQSEFDTEMFFVNGNLNVAGADIEIRVSKDSTGSVIMGDLKMQNSFLINVDYPYATRANATEAWEYTELTHKSIPYLYVDGTIQCGNASDPIKVSTTGVDTVTTSRSNAPYNVFCGSFKQGDPSVQLAADLYIMGDTGLSNFGGNGTSRIQSWSGSVLNRTDNQFYSEGGNIYCNENLTLKNSVIRGDVRVNGNLTLDGSVTIYGNLVVSGTINKTVDELANIVKGDIYNGTVTAGGTGGYVEGIVAKSNTYVSGDYVPITHVKVQNVEYPNAAIENIAQPNFVLSNYAVAGESETGQPVERIDTVYNTSYEEALAADTEGTLAAMETIILQGSNPNADWQYFTDVNGNAYKDVEIYDENGNVIDQTSLETLYISDYNWQATRIMYKIGDTYYKMIPYIDAVTGAITPLPSTSTLYFADGSSVDYVPANVKIYKSDSNGNMTSVETTELSVIYKADVNGNITDVETDSYITYYKVDYNGYALDPAVESSDMYSYFVPDQFGNATPETATEQSIIYRADINGNATTETTNDNFTYYAVSDFASENPISEADAIAAGALISSPGSYLAWYDGITDLGDTPLCFYDEEPTGHEADAAWLDWQSNGGHRVPEADAYESVAVYPISTYTGAGNEVYPEAMTREALNGTANSGKYKVITTLEDVKASIGCSSSGQFNKNVYYDQVPGGTAGFDELTVNSNNTYNVNENTIIKTGTTNAGDITVNINPNGGELWVVLDNCSFGAANNMHRIIVNGNGTVNFFIKDYIYAEKFGIYTKSTYDQAAAGGKIIVREDDKLNINYYGSQGSTVEMANDCLFSGIAKCPYTVIKFSPSGGQGVAGNYSYITSSGIVSSHAKVSWIGNALFKGKDGGNNFNLLYTGSNSEQDDIDNELLKQSWKVMYYDVY